MISYWLSFGCLVWSEPGSRTQPVHGIRHPLRRAEGGSYKNNSGDTTEEKPAEEIARRLEQLAFERLDLFSDQRRDAVFDDVNLAGAGPEPCARPSPRAIASRRKDRKFETAPP